MNAHIPQASKISFDVVAIKQTRFLVNEEAFSSDADEKIRSNYFITSGFNLEQEIMRLVIGVRYHHEEDQTELVSTQVETHFKIDGLGKLLVNGGIDMQLFDWADLIEISVSHTRALLARSLAGTVYQNNLIPRINPIDLAQHFFPESFERYQKSKAEQKT